MKKAVFFLLALLLLSLMPMVLADGPDLNGDVSEEDREKFDQMLEPVMKIYNFIKYIASVIAAIFLLYAGVVFTTSGSDPKKRDQAKNIAMYAIIGLVIIWGAPAMVGLLT